MFGPNDNQFGDPLLTSGSDLNSIGNVLQSVAVASAPPLAAIENAPVVASAPIVAPSVESDVSDPVLIIDESGGSDVQSFVFDSQVNTADETVSVGNVEQTVGVQLVPRSDHSHIVPCSLCGDIDDRHVHLQEGISKRFIFLYVF